MKQYEQAEVEQFFIQLINTDEFYHKPTIKVEKVNRRWRIHVKNMFEYVPLPFAILKQVSEFFETDNINEISRHSRGGCETCDYGSSYEWTLEVW